nr:GAF domain-containing protein [Candidatus Ozemobacteraceae bacterium]
MSSPADSRDQILPELTELVRIGLALSTEKDFAALLEMIVTAARTLTRADAGTLYITDPVARQLQFKILQNDTAKTSINAVRDTGVPIPPPVPLFIDGAPNNGNVSSYVGLTGDTVNIADVYAAKGFNFTGVKNYDQVSGYHSKSMLVIPMKDHEGSIIGVLQLLNARTPKGDAVISFSERDAVLVGSLASQAAVALTNANLLGRMQSDLEEIRRLRDSEKELGDKLREAYIKTERSNEELKEALGKVWVVRLTAAIFLILISAIFWFSSGQAGRLLPFSDLGGLVARKAAPEAASQTSDIPTTGVSITPVSTSITLIGQLEPIQQVNVVSPFSGKIAEVSFVYGQVVQEDDVLASIDPGEVMVRLREAQAALIRAEQNEKMLRNWLSGPEVTRAKMNRSRSRAMLDSLKRKLAEAQLMFSRGIIPKTELESAQESFDNQVVNDQAAADEVKSLIERCSPENLRIAAMEVKNALVRRDELQSQIDRAVVRAPLSGVVLRPSSREDDRRNSGARLIECGTAVEQGQAIVAIGNLEGIMVRSQVDEVNISKIAAGQEAWVTGDAFPGLMLPGSITAVSCQARGSEGGRTEGGKPPSFDVTVTVPMLDDLARSAVR